MMHLGWLDEIRNIALKARLYSPEVQNKTIKYEGNKPKVYLDTKENPTIGIGSNLNSEDNKVILKKLGYNIDKILSGEQEVNLEDRMKLFQPKYTEAVDRAVKYLPDFYKQPNEVQDLLVDLSYNITNNLYDFKNLKQSLINKNYSKAASDLKDSEYYKQTGNRAIDHYNTLLNFPNKYKVVGTDSEIPIMQNSGYIPLSMPTDKKKPIKVTNATEPIESDVSTKIIRGALNIILPTNASQLAASLVTGDSKYGVKDASYEQQKALFNSLENARKRTNKNTGGTEYIDYGKEFDTDLQNLKGHPLSVIAGSALSNDFNAATTFGRVSYEYDPKTETYKVYDSYDYSKTPNIGTAYSSFRNAVGDAAETRGIAASQQKAKYIGNINKKDYTEPSLVRSVISNAQAVTNPSIPYKNAKQLTSGLEKELDKVGDEVKAGYNYATKEINNAANTASKYYNQAVNTANDYYNEAKNYLGFKNGGWLDSLDNKVIEDNRGQWAHPGKVTQINSPNITMQGVNYPVLGVDNLGNQQMMMPNQEYRFEGNRVVEYPMMQNGGSNLPKAQDSLYIPSPFPNGVNPTIPRNQSSVFVQPPKQKTAEEISKSLIKANNAFMTANPNFVVPTSYNNATISATDPYAKHARMSETGFHADINLDPNGYNAAVQESNTMGRYSPVFNEKTQKYEAKFDNSLPFSQGATGRIEPDYTDPITMAVTFGAGAYGKGLGLSKSLGIGLDWGTYGASSLGKSVGKLGLNSLKNSTESGVLSNTRKLNPWAENLNDPLKSYRVTGMDAARDFEATGVLRSNPTIVPTNLSEGILGTRTTSFPSFQKGYADLGYLPEEGGVVFETGLPTFKRGEINPVTGFPIKGRHYAHRVINPETGATMTEIPGENIRMFGDKPHWLKGYPEVPKQLPGSSNAPIGNINDIMFKKYPIPEWFKKEMRFKSLPELNNPDASKVLENFRTRIATPEGKERLKQLGITNTKVFDDLKIIGDENTLGHYWHNRIGLNPELPEVKNVTRHEIEHGVQDAIERSRFDKYNYDAGNFKYLFRPKAKKEAIQIAMKQTSDIDDILGGLELRKTPEKVDWKQLKETQGKNDPSRLFEYMGDKQRATNYFDSGSGGKEKSAFLGEVQQYMMDKGIIPSKSYTEITPEMVKETFINAMFDEKGGKYLRLFNIMKPTENNYNLISKGLNKMLSIGALATIGVGALQQKKQGGTITNNWLDKL